MFKSFILGTIITLFSVLTVNAHEGHGFYHMDGTSGPIIKSRHCLGSMTQMWFIDMNEDGVVDKCDLIFFDHNKIHRKTMEPVDGKCICPGEEAIE